MPLNPLEIKKKEFSKSLRGFDPKEVSAFLESVAEEFDRLASSHREAVQHAADIESRLTQYSSLERNIQQALVQAQESAAKTMDSVQREAGVRLREAELESQRILDNAHREADKILALAQSDVEKFNDEISSLRNIRSVLLSRIKSFLTQQAHTLRELESTDNPAPESRPTTTPFAVPIDEILKNLE